MTPENIDCDIIIREYDLILLDAYGVLVDGAGRLPGAGRFIRGLNRIGKAYFILTNDASRLPETTAHRFTGFGLDIPVDRIITSGSLLAGYFRRHGLTGKRCVVLGPDDSAAYVRRAGGRIVSPEDDFDAIVICDESGFPFLDTMDAVLSGLFRHIDRGDAVRLVTPNPDLIFPKGKEKFGFTSGSLALMIEASLALRYPNRRDLTFDRLGKPYAPIFEEADRQHPAAKAVMIGDQLETDIRGANTVGIASVLIGTGVSGIADNFATLPEALRPSFILPSLIR